jgi:hypothetical protein
MIMRTITYRLPDAGVLQHGEACQSRRDAVWGAIEAATMVRRRDAAGEYTYFERPRTCEHF